MIPDDPAKRLTRLTAILLRLQSGRLVTATTLAEEFGVSVRTIYRDIRALEQSGVPVLTEEGRGYSLMDGYRMAPVTFTEREANALITAGQLVRQDLDASFARDHADAISKVKSVLRQSTRDKANLLSDRIAVKRERGSRGESDHLSALQLALTHFHLVELAYCKAGATEATLRRVEPFALLSGEEVWLLAAWCRLRQAFRMFRLDRIRDMRVLDERFAPHKLTLGEYLEFLRGSHHP